MPAVPKCCCLKRLAPYWSNPPFLAFWHSGLSTRVPVCQKIKMVG